ncbi:hypothetical protein E7X23_26210 [Bacteroides fragilis]|nr:hypothetical protein E7X23_26210 [Bacteroides fragilis]
MKQLPAYIYYFYLQKFGDFPILTTELNDADYAGNVEANKRQPRNEVARFILKDLDEAIARLYLLFLFAKIWRLPYPYD